MKLALYGRLTENTDLASLGDYLDWLQAEGIAYAVHPQYAQELRTGGLPHWERRTGEGLFLQSESLADFEFALSFGGDGTFLNTARIVKGQLPLLGVNFGRLGFLTTVMHDHLRAATVELGKGMYRIDARTGLVVDSNPAGLFGQENFGLNDLTIHKSSNNEMITVHTYINGEFLNSYWGDGLIIATPTGSTAYSLSCGGPIIHPQAGAFAITPVAPHSLTVRPVILPDTYVISFEIESRSGQAMVALDTRTELVNSRTEIAVKKTDYKVRLVRVASGNYLETLRGRLMWGRDTRN